jgi:hypothetical protein
MPGPLGAVFSRTIRPISPIHSDIVESMVGGYEMGSRATVSELPPVLVESVYEYSQHAFQIVLGH